MPWGSWSYPDAPQPQPDQQAVPPGMLKAIQRMLGIEAPNDAAGPKPMTMAQPPVIGNRPDVQEAVKAAGAGAAEPFGQLGRVMTGKSEEPLQDLAMAGIGMIGPPGAKTVLRSGVGAAETALGRIAGKLPAAANANVSQKAVKEMIPPPLDTYERTWKNYTKNMAPDEMMASEPVWGSARELSREHGISESEGFANLVNDYYGRKGINQFMTPDAARRYMAGERGIGVVSK